MAVRDVLKISRKTFFNPKAWFGWQGIKYINSYFYSFFSTQFRLRTNEASDQAETFDQAVERLGIDGKELNEIMSAYQAYAWFFLILSFASFGLALYLLIKHFSIVGFILGLSVVSLLLAQAFRYDFWFLQVKYRILGLTFQEWKQRKPNQ